VQHADNVVSLGHDEVACAREQVRLTVCDRGGPGAWSGATNTVGRCRFTPGYRS